MAYHYYTMDYIDDKNVYLAVMFACKLLQKGNSFTKSIATASRYYDVNPDDVRHFVSQRSGRSQANKNSRKY